MFLGCAMLVVGYVSIVLASVLWSLVPAAIQRFGRCLGAASITFFRALSASLFLLPLTIVFGKGLGGCSIYALIAAVASAIIAPGIGDYAYTKAIKLVGGSLAVIVSYTYIFVASASSALLLGESISLSTALGAVLAFAGVVIAVYGCSERRSIVGLVYAAIASLAWGLGAPILKVAAESIDVYTLSLLRLCVITLMFAPFAYIERGRFRDAAKEIAIVSLATGVLGWGLGMVLFIYSIDLIGVSKTVLATALTPTLSQIFIALLAKEKLGRRTVLGAAITSIGIALSALPT